MSLNIYLKEAVRKAEGFRIITKPGKPEEESYFFRGITIYNSKGVLTIIQDEDSPIAPFLDEFIESVSYYVHVNADHCRRETGLYRHETAEATVELVRHESGSTYFVKVCGTKFVDAKGLVHKFKTGSIRPSSRVWSNGVRLPMPFSPTTSRVASLATMA